MRTTPLNIQHSNDGTQVRIEGAFDLAHMPSMREAFHHINTLQQLDASGITRLDTAGALWLLQLARKGIRITGMREEHQVLYDMISRSRPPMYKFPVRRHIVPLLINRLGEGAVKALLMARELLIFIGQSAVIFAQIIRRPKRLRFGEVTHHIEQIGINAIPIISLIAFLISVVLAYQSVEQLRPMGAQQFTINLITISVLREMGVLLTAIMVAGRSGSAFTAEIGVMKVREETDALNAIGIDPFEMLVIPRLIALVIALPLLTFIANIMGLLGGAILSLALIGTSVSQYIDKVHEIAGNGHALLVGLVKAPVFAFFIGIVGCMHGMKVNGSAESVGAETTASVVQSIFMVLMLDAFFSIFFQQIGI